MNNAEMIEALRQIKSSCDADKHGGMLHFTRMKMIEMGFFDCMPESSLDPFRALPAEWTAFQFAIFDNGVPVKPKRKRSYIERTKVQYGGQIKVWTREEINFRLKTQVSWKANVYLWDGNDAKQVARELEAQNYIDMDTVNLMDQMVDGCGAGYMFSIPVLRTKEAGSRWMKEHIIAVEMTNGKPGRTMMYSPEAQIDGKVWSEQAAGGQDLADNVVAQMRIGRHSGFDAWSTQPAE